MNRITKEDFNITAEQVYELFKTNMIYRISVGDKVVPYEQEYLGILWSEQELQDFIVDFTKKCMLEALNLVYDNENIINDDKKKLLENKKIISKIVDDIQLNYANIDTQSGVTKFYLSQMDLVGLDYNFKYLEEEIAMFAQFYFEMEYQLKLQDKDEEKKVKNLEQDKNFEA